MSMGFLLGVIKMLWNEIVMISQSLHNFVNILYQKPLNFCLNFFKAPPKIQQIHIKYLEINQERELI